MSDYVFIEDLKELGFIDPSTEKSCNVCVNSEVTNPGANQPGLCCKLADWLFLEKGIDNGNAQVTSNKWSTYCEYHNVPLAIAKAALIGEPEC